MKKAIKKIVCAGLSLATLVGGVLAFGGCTTNHPEVEMEISFNGKTYTLEYKLYRKIAPNTVNHFIALAENGYYDGLCVHDYSDTQWVTGAYSYDANKETDGGLVYKDYFSIVSAFENKDFVSVWKDSDKSTPTYTLYGEFSANGMKMDKGDFIARSFGSLSMVYESKGANAADYRVYVERLDGEGMRSMQYEKNSATSMFAINIGGSGVDSNHCTFATLDEDSEEELTDLKNAIAAYIKSNFTDKDEDEEFVESVEMECGVGDPFISEAELTLWYDVPSTPIIIKSVTVTKY